MSSPKSFLGCVLLLLLLLVPLFLLPCIDAQLSTTFYDRTCPNALSSIEAVIRNAVSREPRMAASLIRLHFHDCFVLGCDASILLDEGPSIQSEKTAMSNNESIRGYEVIDDAKSRVENICPGVVSCADIVAIAARDASVLAGGPSWAVKLGRRDSTSANRTQANADLPLASFTLDQLLENFRRKGLNEREMVVLSGSHTIGQARCITFRGRLYNNDTNIDPGFLSTRRSNCPATPGNGDANLAPLDLVTPTSFDTNYFKNLLERKGLLNSDQVLFSGRSTDALVTQYSRNRDSFYSDFAAAMIKMGDINPLTGTSGQIRKVCSVPN